VCAAALLLGGCREPTQMTFVLSTDVPCERVTGVAIAVGAPEDIDSKPLATTTRTCTGAGDLGTIVTVPSGSKTDAMSIKVTVGVGRDPSECQGATFGTGCIAARRSLRYIPHTPLTLGVDLRSVCNGVVCGSDETCVAGACTSALVGDPGACNGNCTEASLKPTSARPQVPSPLVCGDMSGLQAGAIWPMLGYCPTHVGRSPRVGAQTNGVRWVASVGPDAGIKTGITISANGTIYFGTTNGKLYAATPTGQLKWSSLASGGGFFQTVGAIGRDGSVYMGSSEGNLYAFDPGGGVKWSFTTTGQTNLAPNIMGDGTILVGSVGQNNVFAVDPGGALRWQFSTNGEMWASPTIGVDGRIFFGSEDQYMYALGADGQVKWQFFGDHGLQSAVLGEDGRVYFSGKPSICALDFNGTLQWVTDTDADATTPALASDGTVYAGTSAGSFYAFDGRTGTVKWQLTLTPFETWTQPIIGADGLVYIGATDGTFYALTPGGAVKWKLETQSGIHAPAAMGADGTIYFGTEAGQLYAVGP
jgi:outer membrane protein assembly factor BamB